MPTSSSPHHHARPRAQAVTSAPRSQDEDRRRRMRNYLVAMGIRTACFPLAVWAFTVEEFVLAWIAALGAIFIPSFAVMLANAVDRRQVAPDDSTVSPVQALGPVATPEAAGARSTVPGATPYPVQGTVVSRQDAAQRAQEPDEEQPGQDSP